MPGSPNFVGELLILFGAFEDKFVYGARGERRRRARGRLHDPPLPALDAQPRRADGVESRELCRLDLAVIAPLVAVVVALGVYPQFVLDRTEEATLAEGRSCRAGARGDQSDLRSPRSRRPEIDYKALSPLIAMRRRLDRRADGRACCRGRFVQRVLVPVLTLVSLGAAIGLTIWVWEPGDTAPIVEGALAVDTLALGMSMLFYVAGIVTVLLSLRGRRPCARPAPGEYFALLLGSITGWWCWPQAENLITLFIGLELLSIPLYVLCASEVRRATSLEAGLKYLVIGSVGSATLLYGLALVYGATGPDRLRRDRAARSATRSRSATRCCSPASRSPPPGSRSRRRWRRSTSGRRTSTRAPPRRSPRSWRWPPRRRRSRSSCASSTTRWRDTQLDWAPALAALAAVTIVIGNVGRDPAALAQADARLVGRGPGRATCWPAWWWAPSWASRRRPSTSPSTC